MDKGFHPPTHRHYYNWRRIKALSKSWHDAKAGIMKVAISPYLQLVQKLEDIPSWVRLHILFKGTLPDEW